MRFPVPTRVERAGATAPSGPSSPVDVPVRLSRWRERLVMAGSALATLAVIVTGAVVGEGGGAPEDPEAALSDLARRALAELPHAYLAGGSVVVPAATDAGVVLSNYVPPERLDGAPEPLGAHGLADYGLVSEFGPAPAWTREITGADSVYADVGPLHLGCMRWPGESICRPTLLTENEDQFHVFRSGIPAEAFLVEGPVLQGLTFDALQAGQRRLLVVGGFAGTAYAAVSVRLADGSEVSAQTSAEAIAGATAWWAVVDQPVESVRAEAVDAS